MDSSSLSNPRRRPEKPAQNCITTAAVRLTFAACPCVHVRVIRVQIRGNAVLCGQLTRVGAWSPRLDSCTEEQNCVEDADPHCGHRLLRALDQDEHAPRLWRFPPYTKFQDRDKSAFRVTALPQNNPGCAICA